MSGEAYFDSARVSNIFLRGIANGWTVDSVTVTFRGRDAAHLRQDVTLTKEDLTEVTVYDLLESFKHNPESMVTLANVKAREEIAKAG